MPTSTRHTHSQYMLQLDSLRAFAVLAVLIHHFYPVSESMGLGYYGVRLFFVLSGFLITGILLDSRNRTEQLGQGKISACCQFYARRTLRIAPVYYVALLLAMVAGNTDVLSGAWWYATYMSNLLFIKLGFYPSTTAHLWSLAVEAQFYLIWPFVMLFMAKQRIHWVIVLTIVAAPFYRYIATLGSHEGVEFYTFTLSSIDSLGWGALLAWLIHNKKDIPGLQSTGRGLFLFLPMMTPLLMDTTYFYVFDNTLLSIAFIWFVAGAAKGFTGPVGIIMNWKPLLYIGKISYGVYLYHLFIPWALYEVWGITQTEHVLVNMVMLMISTILVASLSWHVLEKPINRLKKYFPYPEATPQVHKSPASNHNIRDWDFQQNYSITK
ncbi:MAG: acyltransferase [Nitrospirales bacterium]|nr:MAG: acyltransferase [Nitrospirales bacterium]